MTHPSPLVRAIRFAAATVVAAALSAPSEASAQGNVVHAVLFYSPTCPHCHEVINRHLPPLRERYGEQFVIIGVDVTTPNGSSLYDAAVEYYALSPDRLGVPLLVIGDVTLLGSQEIPDRLGGLIEDGLAAGGTPWPALPALQQPLAAQGLLPEKSNPVEEAPSPTPSETEVPAPPVETPDSAAATEDPSVPPVGTPAPGITADLTQVEDTASTGGMAQRFLQDPVGNGIAVAALAILVAALVLGTLGMSPGGPRVPAPPGWAVPVLAVAGWAIAVYLSIVEVTGAQAVCGPVGDCNTVQQSEYAHLFGVVPVGILGAMGYLGILTAWVIAAFGPEARRGWARASLWGLALVGVLFSVYLTFLEPFVIGATCAWCISSAMIMAALLLAATGELRKRH